MAAKSKAQASSEVDRRKIVPAECFVTFKSTAEGWAPLSGTGCAHYVAHKLGIRRGKQGVSACDLGFCTRVHDLFLGMRTIVPAEVQVNDIWVSHAKDHCGFVDKVEPAASAKGFPKITISQCSSNEKAGRLGVNQQDWFSFFHGHGTFYRPQ